MNTVLTISVCLCAAASIQFASSANIDATAEWQAHKAQFGKKYDSAQIDALRMQIYLQNKLKVEQFNKEKAPEAGYTMGLNHMSDWTEAEKKQLNGFKLTDPSQLSSNSAESQKFLENILNDDSIEVPDELDWRKTPGRVSKVKDQGQCASCWAFSSTGALEGQELVRKARTNSSSHHLIALSEQNLLDCVEDASGCGGGSLKIAFEYVKRGIDDAKSYPYESKQGKCRFKKNKSVITDSGSAKLPPGDEQALKKMVAKFGPVSVAIDASREAFLQYKSGVLHDDKCQNSRASLDHAVLVVGYGSDSKQGDYWIVKNSWGTMWGEDGYIRMARNKKNNCGIATLATIPTFAS